VKFCFTPHGKSGTISLKNGAMRASAMGGGSWGGRVAALFLDQAAGFAFGVLPAPAHEAIDPARLAHPGVSTSRYAALPLLRAGRGGRS